jgi:hypothetical protein
MGKKEITNSRKRRGAQQYPASPGNRLMHRAVRARGPIRRANSFSKNGTAFVPIPLIAAFVSSLCSRTPNTDVMGFPD